MNTVIQHDPRYPSSRTAQRVNDVLIVSSFAFWATVIAFVPVMAYHLLAA
ncbi:hypothetical protein IC762_29360 [Bradyrhizobium genosp. L]|nr:hypothetical protein [Bradyrhizobium genosp. L]QPF83765.1 hypothetical protein IC762_29360 [Bradyrhizobium genosp. L]